MNFDLGGKGTDGGNGRVLGGTAIVREVKEGGDRFAISTLLFFYRNVRNGHNDVGETDHLGAAPIPLRSLRPLRFQLLGRTLLGIPPDTLRARLCWRGSREARYPFWGRLQCKTPAFAGACTGGEGGIRTPGTV